MSIARSKRIKTYVVIVELCLENGETPDGAEVLPADVGKHRFVVRACSPEQAEEKALDEFHSTVPIGILDNVTTPAWVYEKGKEPLD